MSTKFYGPEQATRLLALQLALQIITNRSISKFDDNLANVEQLTKLILTWAETDEGIVEQVQRLQQAAEAYTTPDKVQTKAKPKRK